MSDENDWRSVAEAAASSGLPIRTIYRWIKSRRLETRSVAGTTMVQMASLATQAARRTAGKTPAVPSNAGNAGTSPAGIAGTTAGKSAVTANALMRGPALDGPTAAQLFDSFELGETPATLVRKLAISPQEAAAAWRAWEDLRALADHRMATETQLEDLAQTVAGLSLKVDDYTSNGRLAGEVHILRRLVDELAKALQALPLPRHEDFVCSCGRRGQLSFYVRCTACGADHLATRNPARP